MKTKREWALFFAILWLAILGVYAAHRAGEEHLNALYWQEKYLSQGKGDGL